MLDLQGPSRRLKGKWDQVRRNYPSLRFSAFQVDLLHWPWLLFQACTTVATWNDDMQWYTMYPIPLTLLFIYFFRPSILRTSRKRASYRPAENIQKTAGPSFCTEFGGAAEATGAAMKMEASDRVRSCGSFHSLVQRCAARFFVQQSPLITVAQVLRILRQLCLPVALGLFKLQHRKWWISISSSTFDAYDTCPKRFRSVCNMGPPWITSILQRASCQSDCISLWPTSPCHHVASLGDSLGVLGVACPCSSGWSAGLTAQLTQWVCVFCVICVRVAQSAPMQVHLHINEQYCMHAIINMGQTSFTEYYNRTVVRLYSH